jgi:hypothetical protein
MLGVTRCATYRLMIRIKDIRPNEMKYEVPVTWVVKGTIAVKANNIEYAAELVQQSGCECEGIGDCHTIVDEMVQGSCKVNWGEVALLVK